MICVEIQAGRMRAYDVDLALRELSHTLTPDHIEDVIILLNALEQEEADDE